jgi:2-dehydro-3-deoxy-D-arabinonate dehydratase
MELSLHQSPTGPRWALDGIALRPEFELGQFLAMPQSEMAATLRQAQTDEPAVGPRLAPLEAAHEVWASGVTYERSRQARRAESDVGDVYDRVYDAARPELFFKAPGWRVRGPGGLIRVRPDSTWSVPEPELVLVINRQGEIIGYTAGDDVSSRSIEGENPLYLPQAKTYTGACALGPGIELCGAGDMGALPIRLEIRRGVDTLFEGETNTDRIHRRLEELVEYLVRELDFPRGVFLMTGTGIVPPDSFSLAPGDRVKIGVGVLVLENEVDA